MSSGIHPWDHVKNLTMNAARKFAILHSNPIPADIFAEIDPPFLLNGEENMEAKFAVFFHDLKHELQSATPPLAAYLAPNRLKKCTSWIEVAYEVRNGM